jgi:hypothetical protein
LTGLCHSIFFLNSKDFDIFGRFDPPLAALRTFSGNLQAAFTSKSQRKGKGGSKTRKGNLFDFQYKIERQKPVKASRPL